MFTFTERTEYIFGFILFIQSAVNETRKICMKNVFLKRTMNVARFRKCLRLNLGILIIIIAKFLYFSIRAKSHREVTFVTSLLLAVTSGHRGMYL